jgi:hypothetical protein
MQLRYVAAIQKHVTHTTLATDNGDVVLERNAGLAVERDKASLHGD